MKPQRIQRKRTKGYDMQAESLALNGLPAVYVGRPSRWGNPFSGDSQKAVDAFQKALTNTTTVHKIGPDSGLFLEFIPPWYYFISIRDGINILRGKNLACWCPLTDKNGDAVPCHADVLLETANR